MANVPGLVTDPSRIKGGIVHVTSGGTKIPAYLATPNQDGNYPGIVVIHEAFGLADHICDLARRFANIGYNAIAPDLYWKNGAPTDPSDINTVFPIMFGAQRQAGGRRPRSRRRITCVAGRWAPPARSGRSVSARAGGTRCCSRAAAARLMPRSIAGVGSSTARRRAMKPPPHARAHRARHGQEPALPDLWRLWRRGPELRRWRSPPNSKKRARRPAPART